MTNPTIQTDIADILREIKSDQKAILEQMQSGQKEILKKVNQLEVSIETLKGDIKALDTKVDQLDKRVGSQEFASRGILIGIVVIVLGGAAKLFGFVDNL